MLDGFIKKISDLNDTRMNIPIKIDEDGYLDRECPNEECVFQFKIFAEDWKNFPSGSFIFCPLRRFKNS